jgi:hypothetical protein
LRVFDLVITPCYPKAGYGVVSTRSISGISHRLGLERIQLKVEWLVEMVKLLLLARVLVEE